MSDFKASVKIEFNFMGKLYKTDMYINYDGYNNGVDRRVQEFFEKAWSEGVERYDKIISDAEDKQRENEERAAYKKLKAKYEPEAT